MTDTYGGTGGISELIYGYNNFLIFINSISLTSIPEIRLTSVLPGFTPILFQNNNEISLTNIVREQRKFDSN